MQEIDFSVNPGCSCRATSGQSDTLDGWRKGRERQMCSRERNTKERMDVLQESKKTLEQKARARGRGGKGGLLVDRSLLVSTAWRRKAAPTRFTEHHQNAPTEHQQHQASPQQVPAAGSRALCSLHTGTTGTQLSFLKQARTTIPRYHAPAPTLISRLNPTHRPPIRSSARALAPVILKHPGLTPASCHS